jgi:hypothetical protein
VIAQLDPGFTREAFWANVAIETFAALVATIGALVIAFSVFQRTTKADRAIFEDQIKHDLEVRRKADEQRAEEWKEAERLAFKRTVISIFSELRYSIDVLSYIENSGYKALVQMRVLAIEQSYQYIGFLPNPVGESARRAHAH